MVGGFSSPVCVCVCVCVCVSTAAVLIIALSSNRLLLMEQEEDIQRINFPPRPSVSILPFCLPSPPSVSLRRSVSPSLVLSLASLFVLRFLPCISNPPVLHHRVLVLLQPSAFPSSVLPGWRGRTSLRGANRLRGENFRICPWEKWA